MNCYRHSLKLLHNCTLEIIVFAPWHAQKIKLQRSLLSILVVVLMSMYGCAPERNTIFSDTYHNTTSRFNAYFIAKEDIIEIEKKILDSYDWNYNLTLPVFPQFDSTQAKSFNEQIEHCITKASLGIQYHKGSKWEDDCYNLVGMARFYSMDYVNAIETFKYVNTKGESNNARHQALVALMRTFIEYNELNNAQAVSDYLKNEKLNRENLKNLYLTRGYLYQKREDMNYMVQNLTQAEPLISDRDERARINFIIGQVYQSIGFDGEAYKYYKNTLRNNPPYELSFHTKLNMAQVTQLARTTDLKKIRKYFRKLLKDRKNEDFKDKIYYELAGFEVRNGNLLLGIEHYNSSIRTSTQNNRQKAHSYWELGKIYYDSIGNYRKAKLYYDSTMSVLPKDELEYEAIQARKEVLENFVKHYDIVHKNDSILHLISLDADSLNAFLNDYIAKEEAAENARREEARKKARLQQASVGGFVDRNAPVTLGANNFSGETWYFYSTAAVDKGRSSFRSIWGNRPLEDNWRLASKAPTQGTESPLGPEQSQNAEVEAEEDEEAFTIDKSALIATLPSTDEEIQALKDEIEEASYQLGYIYNFDLEEPVNAVETFEALLKRFPESEYRYEVMYQLMLILSELENLANAEFYKNLILKEAPESLYGKLIINPNYREDSRIESERLQKVYAKSYKLYEQGQYDEAIALLDEGLARYTDNDYIDNAQLLKILIGAKAGTLYRYEYELNNFIKTYSESELVPYAESLVSASENYQINLVNSSRAKFTTQFDQPHFFVFIYETDKQLSLELPNFFTSLLKEGDNLHVGNLVLDKDYSMILIEEFTDRQSAEQFNARIASENPSEKINKTGKFYNFVITKENFDIFYQTKELETYLTFYRKNYQLK